mmetsp:Transcript_60654/g.163387  ORF Transcript_60654/g.163387 Transcript_60654/m.163387 type:complete len:110 (+) Transcript_60654:83-412(+)
MARSNSPVAFLLLALVAVAALAPAFVAPPARGTSAPDAVELRFSAAAAAGLAPLALEQPASAYDSVVAMLQSWLVGGTVLTVIFAAAIIAAAANPLTKRRQEVQNMMKK